MRLFNQTKKITISENLTMLETIRDKTKGLLGKKDAEAIMFQTRFGIHTFFMHFPLDVLILDQAKKVVKIKENLKPNRLFFWPPKYETVIELPAGTIKKTNTELNDTFLL